MRLKLDKTTLLKGLILLVLVAAIAMGAVELIFLIDLGGLDFAVTFLLIYFAAVRDALIFKYREFKSAVADAIVFLASLYMFQPKVFISHVSASGILVALTCSLLLASLMWIPLIYVSSGFLG